MKPIRAQNRPAPQPPSPAVKHYIALTVFWLLAVLHFAVLALEFGFPALARVRGRHMHLNWSVIGVDTVCLIFVVSGIVWYTKWKKAPALTALDARVIGAISAWFATLMDMIMITNVLHSSNRSRLTDLLAVLPPVVIITCPAIYWFARAKRIDRSGPPAEGEEA